MRRYVVVVIVVDGVVDVDVGDGKIGIDWFDWWVNRKWEIRIDYFDSVDWVDYFEWVGRVDYFKWVGRVDYFEWIGDVGRRSGERQVGGQQFGKGARAA